MDLEGYLAAEQMLECTTVGSVLTVVLKLFISISVHQNAVVSTNNGQCA